MRSGGDSQFARDLGRIFGGDASSSGDRALLDGFARRSDAEAFAALVARHGPMVRGVCRRILLDAHDVDDAFQATFVVMLRKAGRVEHADRLAPWLFGVATRVALKARARATRRRARLRIWTAAEVDAVAAPPGPRADLDDVLPLIDAEIARLPAKLRAAVVACLVDGATPDEAARRLGCPVGTVKSRLARGRDTLRVRLTRRGLAPSVALAAADLVAPAPVTPALLRLTRTVAASRTVAPTMLALTRGVAPTMLARSTVAALLIGGIALAGGGLTAARRQSSAHAQQASPAPPSGVPPQAEPARPKVEPAQAPADPETTPAGPTLADRLAAVKAEYQARRAEMRAAQEKAATRRERDQVYAKMNPDDVIYCRRMIDLALTDPADPAARDALIWVINKPYRADYRAYGDEFARAAALLVRHHGDDPAAVAVGLDLTNTLSARRDALLLGFMATARGRETKGTARLALAQYLEKKAQFATGVGPNPPRGKHTFVGMVRDDGTVFDKTVDESDEDYSYKLALGLCDPKVLRAEAERLYDEVITDYGDVPWVNVYLRELAALLRDPEPQRDGKPMTADEIDSLRATIAAKRTLGRVAEQHLDEMHNIAPGKPAPEIEGITLDGKPLKLSDFRGKVVVLSFWESGCGPCIREMPRERELVEKYRDRPFAFLGVDREESKAAGLKVVEAQQVTWPNWHDGGDGPIAARYHIKGFPTTFIIDGTGIIRHKNLIGEGLDKAVAQLLGEMAGAAAAR